MILYFEILLFLILIGTALAVFFTKKNLTAVIIFTAFSLVMSLVWVIIKSPDLAITEAAVGAGITSLLFYTVLSTVEDLKEFENIGFKKNPEKKNKSYFNIISIGLTLIIVGLLLFNVSYLPEQGSSNNPAVNEVYSRYVENSVEETGAINLVAAVILDYRAFDTFGEAVMIFTALIVVMMLLKKERRTYEKDNRR